MFRAVALLVLLPFQTGGNSSADALKLLTEVSRRYADAKSYRIEAVEEWTSNSELSRSWTKSYMTAAKASGSRYYYAGRSPAGNADLFRRNNSLGIPSRSQVLYPAPGRNRRSG